jgi:ElaB/YqjD/DUF883 family membrane-anchored ribosome-binding protein
MKNSKDTAHTPKELLTELQARTPVPGLFTAFPPPKEFLAELHALVAEAEAMMADSRSEPSSEAFGKLRARFGAAQERFADIYAGAKKRIVAGAKCTDVAIRDNLYQSLAIAFGVGVLVGALVGRRNK